MLKETYEPTGCMHCHGPVTEDDMTLVVLVKQEKKLVPVEGKVCTYECMIGELYG